MGNTESSQQVEITKERADRIRKKMTVVEEAVLGLAKSIDAMELSHRLLKQRVLEEHWDTNHYVHIIETIKDCILFNKDVAVQSVDDFFKLFFEEVGSYTNTEEGTLKAMPLHLYRQTTQKYADHTELMSDFFNRRINSLQVELDLMKKKEELSQQEIRRLREIIANEHPGSVKKGSSRFLPQTQEKTDIAACHFSPFASDCLMNPEIFAALNETRITKSEPWHDTIKEERTQSESYHNTMKDNKMQIDDLIDKTKFGNQNTQYKDITKRDTKTEERLNETKKSWHRETKHDKITEQDSQKNEPSSKTILFMKHKRKQGKTTEQAKQTYELLDETFKGGVKETKCSEVISKETKTDVMSKLEDEKPNQSDIIQHATDTDRTLDKMESFVHQETESSGITEQEQKETKSVEQGSITHKQIDAMAICEDNQEECTDFTTHQRIRQLKVQFVNNCTYKGRAALLQEELIQLLKTHLSLRKIDFTEVKVATLGEVDKDVPLLVFCDHTTNTRRITTLDSAIIGLDVTGVIVFHQKGDNDLQPTLQEYETLLQRQKYSIFGGVFHICHTPHISDSTFNKQTIDSVIDTLLRRDSNLKDPSVQD